MARIQRISLTGQAHHVIQRGNNHEPVFFDEDDYVHYMGLLKEYAAQYVCDVHAYVLMTNHVHLLVTPQRDGGLSKLMQKVGQKYVRHINKTYKRSGTLWEGRFRSSMIDAEEYLLSCMRYIELNPVRAKMVRRPEKYEWSSYNANGLGAIDPLITPHPLYQKLALTPVCCQSAYRRLFDAAISQDDFDTIRSATKGGWAVGSDKFKSKIERALKVRVSSTPRGGDRRSEAFRSKKSP